MKQTLKFVAGSALALTLVGCDSVPVVPDKAPCSSYILKKTGGMYLDKPCEATPIMQRRSI